MLAVRKVFGTMQGEGSRAGAPVVFIRLVGCNLWSGIHSQRGQGVGACAAWCDTDFASGSKMEPQLVVEQVLGLTADWQCRAVVISGGEPCLQLRRPAGEQLVTLLKDAGVHVAVETNGTVNADILASCDHVTVSPKMLVQRPDDLSHVVVRKGTDLKVVFPQWNADSLAEMGAWNFDHRYLQPLDDGGSMVSAAALTLAAASRVGWKVSVQTHKLLEME